MTGAGFQLTGALRHRDFVFLLSGRFCTSLAAQMMTVAIGWQVYAITRDPLDLGLIGLSQFLPFVLLILPAGYAADHLDRRRIVTFCYAIQALSACFLLALTLAGMKSIQLVFAVMVLLGVARAFSMPTGQALLPNVVPPQDFNQAVALSSSSMHIATVFGPVLGGVLFLGGPQLVYMTAGLLLLVSIGMSLGIRTGGRSAALREPVNLHTLLSGLRFVRSKPIVLGAISLDLFAVLFGGAVALLPVYASDILHVGPVGLGLLRTAPGVGAGLCALVIAFVPITRHVGGWMFGSVALFGVATIVFGASTVFWISLVALVVLGAADMISVYIRHLLVQLETPDAIRGRVSAVSAVFIGASNELGEFESGVTAAWWGVVPAVVIGGAASVAVAGIWMKLFPVLATMQQFPAPVGRDEEVERRPA
jgi:MFS family permease